MTEQQLLAALTEPVSYDPIRYQMAHQLFDNNAIVFNQEIESDIVETFILPLLDMEANPNVNKITIYLSTCGGSLFDGFIICNILENLKTPTDLIVLGTAHSLGAVLLTAGYHNPNVIRKAYPFSVGLLHDGEYAVSGASSKANETVKFYQKMSDIMRDYIVSHSRFSLEELESRWEKEFFMTADEMLEYGLIDEIIGVSKQSNGVDTNEGNTSTESEANLQKNETNNGNESEVR